MGVAAAVGGHAVHVEDAGHGEGDVNARLDRGQRAPVVAHGGAAYGAHGVEPRDQHGRGSRSGRPSPRISRTTYCGAVAFEQGAADVFAHEPEHDELDAGKDDDADVKRGPARGQVHAEKLFEQAPHGHDQAETRDAKPEHGGKPQRRDGEVDEHGQPQADELEKRVAGLARLPVAVLHEHLADVVRGAQDQSVHVGGRTGVTDDLLHQEAA